MDAAAHALILRRMRHWITAASWTAGALAFGQTATLQSGTLHVLPGTTMRFSGVSDLVIAAGAQVINDGLIDLGADCLLQEQPGAPITGSGVEQAVWPIAAPLTGAEPGRLGLTITTDYAAGDLEVTRGHQPAVLPNSAQGVARWFAVLMPSGATDAGISFRYDLSELNGLDPQNLSLFEAPLLAGPWLALASINQPGAQLIDATDQAPVAFITAFDQDAPNRIPLTHGGGWSAAPTVVTDHVRITVPEGLALNAVELLGADGRVLLTRAFPSAGPGMVLLELPVLASGAYLLRLNNEWTQRLIKP